jgi:hypothetical protein
MRISLLFGLAFILFMETVPAIGHNYSFAAEYDGKKPVDLTGTVTKVEWMNPHARFHLDVKDDAGRVTNWEFELGSLHGLMRKGRTRDSVKVGEVVSVRGSQARDRSYLVNARTVRLSDGRQLYIGPASDRGTDVKSER